MAVKYFYHHMLSSILANAAASCLLVDQLTLNNIGIFAYKFVLLFSYNQNNSQSVFWSYRKVNEMWSYISFYFAIYGVILNTTAFV